MDYHEPVLLSHSVDGLAINPSGTYVDVTFGGGGHSRAILERLNSTGRLYAFDQDPDAQQNIIDDERCTLIPQNFRFINRYLRFYGVRKVDGILADLGVSSHQFDEASRGFSTRFDADLDMRMNQSGSLTAYQVINGYDEEALAEVLFRYGELRNARTLAAKIVGARSSKAIKTSFDLKKLLEGLIPKSKEHKVLAQLFQGIRIEVNQEIAVLKEFLQQVPALLNPAGRLVVISYHSLEDRLVKRFIRSGLFEGEPEKDVFGHVSVPLKKVGKLIVPDAKEIERNNRARSAKLRIASLCP
ncbi:MAG: 16S rRNA (cytosine(1402)-N(4))-methyltransferase RsmH [Lutibacter sp.]|jgi:16S rRNA (cytosine1402-N4)-methyltransferase|nr:16S rRNA (cytosine(1402)-N(4))-methyltransferase RsmH [Lutibacter sp.]